MTRTRLRATAPYAVVLAIAGYLYYLATQIEFTAPGDRKSTRLNSSHVSEFRMPSSA